MKDKLNTHRPLLIMVLIVGTTLLAITASANFEAGTDAWVVTAAAATRTASGDCADQPGKVCKELCLTHADGRSVAMGYFECRPTN